MKDSYYQKKNSVGGITPISKEIVADMASDEDAHAYKLKEIMINFEGLP